MLKRPSSTISTAWDRLSPLEREAEWRKCRNGFDGFRYFCATYYAIKVPGKGQQPFVLREAQVDTARIWFADRFSVTLKARQVGYSTLLGALSLWHVMFHPDREIILLSKTGKDATKLLSAVKYAWKALPPDMRERAGKVEAETIERFALNNGSSVQSLNSNNPARGYSAYLIFVDEFAFYEKAHEAWAAIEPAADVGGRIHVLSTANGVGNAFHEMWVKATTGISDFKYIFCSWRGGDRDDNWYADKARRMPEWQLHQEYPSTPEEAFIKSGRPVFDPGMLQRREEAYAITPEFRGYIDESGRFTDNPDGELAIWSKPVKGHKYVIGADVAEGLEHGDYSVAYVFDLSGDAAEQVAEYVGHLDPVAFGEMLVDLGYWYNRALIAPEVNNHGYTTCQVLKARKYRAIYRRYNRDQQRDKKVDKLGWHTNHQSKRLMIDELRQAISDEDVIVRSPAAYGELRTFVRDSDGKMHGSPYDDKTMALAITNQMRLHWFQRDPDEPMDPTGTWAEYEDRMDARKQTHVPKWRIGLANVY